MLRCIGSFLGGLVLGVVGTLVSIFVFEVGLPDNDDVVWFEHEGTCLTYEPLKTLRTLGPDRALVAEADDILLEAPIMLLIAHEASPLYDEQIIKIPSGRCARHVGNFNYKTKDDNFKTVPVVMIKE